MEKSTNTSYDMDNSTLVCSICLEDIAENANTTKLECSHIFHLFCFTDFVYKGKTNKCPNCRVVVEDLQKYKDINKIDRANFYREIDPRTRNPMYDFEMSTRDLLRRLNKRRDIRDIRQDQRLIDRINDEIRRDEIYPDVPFLPHIEYNGFYDDIEDHIINYRNNENI